MSLHEVDGPAPRPRAFRKRLVLVGIGGASCSGKTLLAKNIRRALPKGATIVHQDDFAPPIEYVPYSSQYPDIQDWDDPPTCLLWSEFRSTLQHIRETGALPKLHQSHDHLNKNVEVEIDPEALVKWTQRFQELEDELKAGGEEIVWFIVDGFVLYWDPQVIDLLDVRFFLRVPHDILKHRRDERQVYVLQTGGVWVDPPEYFTQIVYPAYLKAYGGMFKDGDVEHGALRKDWENQVQVLRPLEGADEMSRAFELSCEAIVRSVREGAGRPIGGRE